MIRLHSYRSLVALLLPLTLCCGCLPTTPPDAKASLQALQPQAPAPSADLPPLQTSLDPGEQDRFRLDYARLLMDGGRDGEAEALLDKLRYSDKLAPEAYPLLAKIYERKNMPREALLAWQKALSLHQGDPELMARVARAALVCKEYPLADGIFNQWLADNPAGSRLHIAGLNNLGFSSLLQKKYEQAGGFLDQAIALDPLNQRARANLALLEGVRKNGPAAMVPDTSLLPDDPTPLDKQKENGPTAMAPNVSPETILLPVISAPLDKQKKKRVTAMAPNPSLETSLLPDVSVPLDKQQEKGLVATASNPNPAIRVLRAAPTPATKDNEESRP